MIKTIRYEQAHQENLDITFIMKYTDTENERIIEVSGFYYGKPDDKNLEIYKDGGIMAKVSLEYITN